MTRADRIAGCMFGAAIGDALGAAFELVDSDVIERHLGAPIVRTYVRSLPESLLHPRGPGKPTDDTAMALSVALAIASGEPLTPSLFAKRFLADLDSATGRFGEMFWNEGPGGATTRALRRLHAGAGPARCGHNEDGGNGAAMRAHPVGFLANRRAVLTERASCRAAVSTRFRRTSGLISSHGTCSKWAAAVAARSRRSSAWQAVSMAARSRRCC